MARREKVVKVKLIGRADTLRPTLEALQEKGIFHPEKDTSLEEAGEEEEGILEDFARAKFLVDALELKAFEEEMTLQEALGFYKRFREEFREIYQKVSEAIKAIEEAEHFLPSLREREKIAKVLQGMDISLLRRQRHTFTLFGICEKKPSLPEKFAVRITGRDPFYVLVVGKKEDLPEAEKLLAEVGFESLPLPKVDANRELAEVQRRISSLQEKAIEGKRTLENVRRTRAREIFRFYQILSALAQRARTGSLASRSRFFFVLSGWVRKKDLPLLRASLSKIKPKPEIIVESGEGGPTALSHNPYEKLFFGLVKMFGVPGIGEVDPTPVFSITFPLFFGMMLADVGYGLLLALAGIYLWVVESRKTLASLIGILSLSTMFFGFVFGSFFCGAIPLPALFDPMKDPMTLLKLAIALGALHFIIAGFYVFSSRSRDLPALFGSGLTNVSFGLATLMFLLGLNPLPLLLVWAFSLFFSKSLAAALEKVWDLSKPFEVLLNLFSCILASLEALLEVSSFLGNILSYARIMAIFVAGAALGGAIKLLAGMVGGLPGLGILGVFLFVLGHLFNFVLNLMGAFIHSLRLHFLEFMPRFYEGKGKEFKPLSYSTDFLLVR